MNELVDLSDTKIFHVLLQLNKNFLVKLIGYSIYSILLQ